MIVDELKAIYWRFRSRVDDALLSYIKKLEERRCAEVSIALKNSLSSCGKDVRFNGKVFISNPAKVKLEGNVHIGDGCFFKTEGGLFIGENTHISRNVTIYTSNHNYEGGRLPYDEEEILKSVEIGRNVWVGMNVCIAPGSKIGEGAIVGLGTVVSGNVPPMAIIGNQKFRIIKKRDEAHYRKLESLKEYGGVSGKRLG